MLFRSSWRRFERLAPFFIVEKLAVVLFTSSVTVLLAFVFHPFGASTQLVFSFALLCIGWDLQAFSSNALRSVLNFSGEFWTKSLGATGFPVVLAVTGLTGGSLSVPQLCLLQGGFLLVAGFAGVLLLRRNVPSLVPPRRHIRRGLLALGKIGAPLTLAASAGVLQTSIDSIVLGSKNLLETNASFTLVNRLGQIVQLPVNIVMFAALPYIVDKLDRGRRAPDGSLLRLATKILVSSACAAAQIFILAVVVTVPALLGDKYSDVRIFGEVDRKSTRLNSSH